MIKWIFKWSLRLVYLAVILIVIFFLSLNSILRVIVEHQIRKQTGMDAEIGRFHFGLAEPTIEIQNLKLYNSPDFGGVPFLDIPEIHIEYDRPALARHEIHITLMRFNLGELDIVKNEAGRTNIFALGIAAPTKKTGIHSAAIAKQIGQTGFDFQKIDVLNVSVGTAKFIDLKNPLQNRSQKIGIENCVIKNIKSRDDLDGLEIFIALRGGNFFSSLINPTNARAKLF